jgi:hypothetical protein
MSRRRTKTYIVVVLRAVLYRVEQAKSAFAPRVRTVAAVMVRVTGCDGANAEMLAAHLALAAVSGGALALASVFTDPATSALLKLAGELAVGAIAVHAAVTLVRSRSRALPASSGERSKLVRGASLRVLIADALVSVADHHAVASGLRALALACKPGERGAALKSARSALLQVGKLVFSRAAVRPAKRAVPGLGQALAVMSLYRTTLDSARFVHQFALTAAETYQLPAAA